jgi:glycosyltransferase involved in cell wall biosynthesis
MRILSIHNRYRETGGEDVVVEQEARLLTEQGHHVTRYSLDNGESVGLVEKLKRPMDMVWSGAAMADIRRLIELNSPDLAHIHNTHYRVSLGAVRACTDLNVPVVMTLHNYRIMCPAATLFRDGVVCEECVGRRVAIPGVIHGCWRGSRAQTASVAVANGIHQTLGTLDHVARFIAPSEFTRLKYIEHGLEGSRVVTRPHLLAVDPGVSPLPGPGEGFVSIGRLSLEKGTDVLLEAWKDLTDVPLRVVGDGPLRPLVDQFIADHPGARVEALGALPHEAAMSELRTSLALVHASTCYETFGIAPLEAMAMARPVIVAGHGAPADLVEDGVSGVHFTPSSPTDLRRAVRRLWNDRQMAAEMGDNGRSVFEARFDPLNAYRGLMDVYESAVGSASV